MWSPNTTSITYDVDRNGSNDGRLALVHEIGHALLEHRIYQFDAELVKMEMDAWEMTRKLAASYGIAVDENYIAECIDSYDHWMTKRATCPDCTNFSLQRARDEYSCFGCGAVWQVNWRKDRRVTRRITHRYEHPVFVMAQFAERADDLEKAPNTTPASN